MNAITSFRLCTLTDEELVNRIDELTDNMFREQKVPTRHIPARPDSDYDLLLGELLVRFNHKVCLPGKSDPKPDEIGLLPVEVEVEVSAKPRPGPHTKFFKAVPDWHKEQQLDDLINNWLEQEKNIKILDTQYQMGIQTFGSDFSKSNIDLPVYTALVTYEYV